MAGNLNTATTTADKSCWGLFVSSLFLPLASVAMVAVPQKGGPSWLLESVPEDRRG